LLALVIPLVGRKSSQVW